MLSKIKRKTVNIGVLGVGYVGLPLALLFVEHGFKVFGFDPDKEKTKKIRNGESPINYISDVSVKDAIERGFKIGSYPEVLKTCDVFLICVPTPLTKNKEPDLSAVVSAANTVKNFARPGSLVVLESTTWPGTTVELLGDILQENNVLLAYSPERENPGGNSVRNITKVVAGETKEASAAAVLLYSMIVNRVHPARTTRVAEAAKLLENSFRAVNIALVNELKVVFAEMGIDIWDVIEAADTKGFGFMKFTPGPGVGGHCIAIDPLYLNWKAREFKRKSRLIEAACEINESMPEYVGCEVLKALSDRGKKIQGSHALIVGMAYKANVSDTRESPAFDLMEFLKDRGVEVEYHDEVVEGNKSVPLYLVSKYDVVVITTAHSDVDWNYLQKNAQLIVDTRNVYYETFKNVVKA